MPKFKWEGTSPKGEVVRGEMEAATRDAVIIRLRSQRIQPTPSKIREAGTGLSMDFLSIGERTKAVDVVIFTRQFSTMIDAGLPIVQCLDILHNQTLVKVFAKAIGGIKDDVESGSTLADAMRKHPKEFDELYVNMVAAGEVGGILDAVLARLATYMEKAEALKRKIKTAMIYPCAIIVTAFIVTAILLIYVIPVFAELYDSFGQELPALTQFVIRLSNFAQDYFFYIIGGMVFVGFLTNRFYQTERGRLMLDGLLLRLPIFGDIFRKAAVARFTRTLSTLVSSGVPILDALAITAKTAGNRVVEKAVFATRVSISQGKTIAEPLQQSGVFPPMVCQMIAVGETTGALDAMLAKISDFYEAEVDSAVDNLTQLMEPLVIAFLGVVIGGLVIAMYLPIFQLGAVVS